MDEASRPRKRGRLANSTTSSQAQPEPEASQAKKAKRKRGPSPTVQTNGDGGDEAVGETEGAATEKRKRGRPRVSQANDELEEVEEHDTSNAASENAPPRKRGRPPKEAEPAQDGEAEADEADDENEGDSSLLRRSSRVRRPPNSLEKGGQEAPKPKGKQVPNNQKPDNEKRKRVRPSLNERPINEPDQESVPQPKKKRGRPSLNNQPPADAEVSPEPPVQPKKRGRPSLDKKTISTAGKEKRPRGRPSREHEDNENAAEEDRPGRARPRKSDKAPRQSREHRRSPENQDRSSSPDSGASPRRYRHLTTRTRRVPRNVIEAKWTPLEAPAIASVTSLLQSASRPVLLRLNTNPQRHAHAATVLNAVSKRLRAKIAKGLPFPPATTSTKREDEFEYERAVAGIQTLESQLDPLLHGVELLRREKERAERELEVAYKRLRYLSSNARAEARERRDRIRKMHALVPDKPPGTKAGDMGDMGEVVADKGIGTVFADFKDGEEDEELKGLAAQIASHMESMRGNLQQIDGVVPAIERSQGLLRAALQSRLDREVLENVILG